MNLGFATFSQSFTIVFVFIGKILTMCWSKMYPKNIHIIYHYEVKNTLGFVDMILLNLLVWFV